MAKAESKKDTKVKPMTKSEVLQSIADAASLTRKDVGKVFDELTSLIGKSLKKKNGVFVIPGLLKIYVQTKPATKATERPSPFDPSKMMKIGAKPARQVVKVRPLKSLKEMA